MIDSNLASIRDVVQQIREADPMKMFVLAAPNHIYRLESFKVIVPKGFYETGIKIDILHDGVTQSSTLRDDDLKMEEKMILIIQDMLILDDLRADLKMEEKMILIIQDMLILDDLRAKDRKLLGA